MIKKRGFTLIELLTVVSILAILAAIAVPGFQYHIKRSKNLKAFNEGLLLYNAFMNYYNQEISVAALSYTKASDFMKKISGEAPEYINIYKTVEVRAVIRYTLDKDLYTLEIYPQKNQYSIKDVNNRAIHQ